MKVIAIAFAAFLALVSFTIVGDSLDVQAAPGERGTLAVAASGSSSINHKIVRVEYLDQIGNGPHTDTIVHIINTSYTTPVVLTTVYLASHQGLAGPGVSHSALVGTVIPPLGRLNFAVDSSIPGVVPQTAPNTHSIFASAIVGWTGGTDETVQLSATVDYYAPGNSYLRARYQIDGHPVTP